MKVIDKTKATKEFCTVNTGECFIYDNCLFIKICFTGKLGNSGYNCVCFVDNKASFIDSSVRVTPVDAEIVINSKGAE